MQYAVGSVSRVSLLLPAATLLLPMNVSTVSKMDAAKVVFGDENRHRNHGNVVRVLPKEFDTARAWFSAVSYTDRHG